jgi:hypothetical protein
MSEVNTTPEQIEDDEELICDLCDEWAVDSLRYDANLCESCLSEQDKIWSDRESEYKRMVGGW